MRFKLRLLDYSVYDKKIFSIRMFGINKNRETFSIKVNDFKPFIYIEITDGWNYELMTEFEKHITKLFRISMKDNLNITIISKKKLYGFDCNKYYDFIRISTPNYMLIKRIKSLYYVESDMGYVLNREGYEFYRKKTKIYESFVLPLLRFFHIREISPSGWVEVNGNILKKQDTTCDYNLVVNYNDIVPLDCDDIVPYKICSFDIEANSSHGNFPEAIKTYKKVSHDIINYYSKYKNTIEDTFKDILMNIFSFRDNIDIDKCYTKDEYELMEFNDDFDKISSEIYKHIKDKEVESLDKMLNNIFPKLKGDEITFIGSTFINYGSEVPYRNNCICLNDTESNKDYEIVCCSNEKDLLLKWKELILEEDPDIIIGYNIFGFDYSFMYDRAYGIRMLRRIYEFRKV